MVGVFSSALRGNVADRAFEYFKERLLDALAADVARNGNVFHFAADFVDFVDVHDSAFRAGHVEIRRPQEVEDYVFDVFANVARLGYICCVADCERHV